MYCHPSVRKCCRLVVCRKMLSQNTQLLHHLHSSWAIYTAHCIMAKSAYNHQMLIIDVTELVIPEHKQDHGTHRAELPPKSQRAAFSCRPKSQHAPTKEAHIQISAGKKGSSHDWVHNFISAMTWLIGLPTAQKEKSSRRVSLAQNKNCNYHLPLRITNI